MIVDPLLRKQGRVGRADLLDCLRILGEEGLRQIAVLFGFERLPDEEPLPRVRLSVSSGPALALTPGKIEHVFEPTMPKARFWRVVSCRQLSDEEVAREEPVWLKNERPLTGEDIRPDAKARPPAPPPLARWSRLWPLLRGALGYIQEGPAVDWRRTIDSLACTCRPLHRLPRLPCRRWASLGLVILDLDHRTAPFWTDFHALAKKIKRLRGRTGLDIQCVIDGPEQSLRPWKRMEISAPYRLPSPDSPILVLGDLGCFDPSGRAKGAWLRFGRRLQRAGFVPTALTPSPPRLWDAELASIWRLVAWDRAVRFPRLDLPSSPGMRPRPNAAAQKGKDLLLRLLSPAVSVEPPLLRAMRLLLPRAVADAGSEAEVWSHPDVHTCLLSFSFASATIAKHRQAFQQEPSILQEQAADLIRCFHVALPLFVREEEDLLLRNLQGRTIAFGPAAIAMARLAKTMDALDVGKSLGKGMEGVNSQGIRAYVQRLANRQHPAMWQACEALAVLWAKANKEAWKEGRRELPPGLDLARVAWVFSEPTPPRAWRLWQQGMSFLLTTGEEVPACRSSPLLAAGSLVGRLFAGGPRLQVERQGAAETSPYGEILAEEGAATAIPAPPIGTLRLTTDQQEIVLDLMTRPAWATAMGRDRHGLFADFEYGRILQRMRWISPGRFLMGSPENEPERFENELQHEVVLTKGFWLADTACTQALWQAFMGENPSRFKSDHRPVETVSWEDCMKFLEKINGLVPGLDLRLPTEAEWEYACRAGTVTPFSFGNTITTEQVNYDGNYPYAGGAKGIYRHETVEVRSLPCNPWGLYEMHGNVWEWCWDWYGAYAFDSVVDHRGPSEGALRVLRGGGWIRGGGSVRSARRNWFDPAERFDFFGFRLARGQRDGG